MSTMKQARISESERELRVMYVEYSTIREFISDANWDRTRADFLEVVPAELVSSHAQSLRGTRFTAEVLAAINRRRGQSGTLEDFGVLALVGGQWRVFIASGLCYITLPLRFRWTHLECSGECIYVFVPDMSFVGDNLASEFGIDAPGRLIVSTRKAGSDSEPVVSILRPRSFGALIEAVSASLPRCEVSHVSVLPDIIEEEAPFPRARAVLGEALEGIVKVEMTLVPPALPLALSEADFLGPDFVDDAQLLTRLEQYFSSLAEASVRAELSAVYTTMVQSSCWGKSRFAEQLLHLFLGCFTCFRAPREQEAGFPRSEIWASFFVKFFEMNRASGGLGEREKEAFCLLYLCATVLAIDYHASRSLQQLLDDLRPLQEADLGTVFSRLEAELAELEAVAEHERAQIQEREARLRCELLVLGQISGAANSFGKTFFIAMSHLMRYAFPSVLDQLINQLRDELASWGLETAFSENPARVIDFCSGKGFTHDVLSGIGRAFQRPSSPLIAANAVDLPEVVRAFSKLVSELVESRAAPSRKLLVIVFDEATVLTGTATTDAFGVVPFRYLRRALVHIQHLPVAALFIGTNLTVTNFYSAAMLNSDRFIPGKRILQPLVLLPGKDVWEKEPSFRLAPTDIHSFLDAMRLSQGPACTQLFLGKFSCFGRPVWKVLGEAALSFALQKLKAFAPVPVGDAAESCVRWIAALGASCSLEASPSSSLATVLVRSYMATLANIDIGEAPQLICTYASEPVLASAAVSVLFHQGAAGLQQAVEELQRAFLLGSVNKGFSGELVARILFMAARNREVEFPYRPVTLLTFLLSMVAPGTGAEAEAEMMTDFSLLQAALTRAEDLSSTLVNFVQFIPLSYRHSELEQDGEGLSRVPEITAAGIFSGLRRACAFSMMPNFPGLDFLVPLSFADGRLGYIGVQVKCRTEVGPENPVDVFDGMLAAWKVHADHDVANPVNIYLQLGSKPERMSNRKFRTQGYRLVAASDSPSVALYMKTVTRQKVRYNMLFLHILSIDSFAGAVPSSSTRAALANILRWGSDLVDLSKTTQMHPDVFGSKPLLYGDNPGGVAFQTHTQNFFNENYWPLRLRLPELFYPPSLQLL